MGTDKKFKLHIVTEFKTKQHFMIIQDLGGR